MAENQRTIGIYGVPELEMFHRPIEGMLRYCEEHDGFRVRDFRMSHLLDISESTSPPWRGRVDGVILGIGASDGTTEQMADWILRGGVPAVSVAADWMDPRIPTVYVHRESLAKLAVEHLTQCGCKSFLYYGYAHSAGSLARASAMRAILKHRTQTLIELATPQLFAGTYEDECMVAAETDLAHSLRTLRRPVGVWTVNDNYAHAVCQACEQLGLEIPTEVSVLGVDDLSIARLHAPTISSIRTPGEEVGYVAMRTLHDLLRGKRGIPTSIEVKAGKLIARNSTTRSLAGRGGVDEALAYIGAHACSGVTVEQLAKIAGGSRRSLEERFQREVGHSPGEEIRRVRLDYAKKLLVQSELSISRIASMVGYAETAAFSKFFRNGTGTTPRAFRSQAS